MQTIRWGIIGCGNVTEVKSGPGFQQAEHSQLVAVMRRDAQRARDYAERHGVPRWYDDAHAHGRPASQPRALGVAQERCCPRRAHGRQG